MSIANQQTKGHRRPAPVRFVPAALVALGLAICPTPGWGQGRGREVTDQGITRAIETRLQRAPEGDASRVEVGTKEGIVTLSGSVPSLGAKERALGIARRIRGVTSVEDRIEVRPTEQRADEQIREDVRAALAAAGATDEAARQIDVRVEGGVVTLSGTAPSRQMADLAEEVVGDVRGVREVRNGLRIGEPARQSDQEIADQIRRRIRSDAGLAGSEVRVAVRDGKVTLGGTVGSLPARLRAIRDARVPGVNSIEASGLAVRWRTPTEGARPATPAGARSDEEIRDAVRTALAFQPRLIGTQTDVRVVDGVVTLTGEVRSLRAKQAAQRATWDIAGVRQVRNELQVRGGGTPAERTVQAVVAALERDAYLHDDKITVNLTDGTARLRGDVDSAFERARAEQIASGIGGVAAVRDELTVGGRAVAVADRDTFDYDHPFRGFDLPGFRAGARPRSDAEIKDDIEDELFWSPFVDGDEVRVTVQDGVATLTGTVDTRSEHGAAIENAYEGGARSVRDQLQVRQDPATRRP